MTSQVWGHRGTRSSAHKPGPAENTLAAMQYALDQGAHGIELDVRLCTSGEVIVLHDRDLQRVQGVALAAESATLAELRPYAVPVLNEAIDLVLAHGTRSARLNIEIKPDVPDADALCRAVSACIAACSEQSRLLVSSFSADICSAMHALLPELEVGFLFERIAALPAGIRAVHPHHALLDAELIARFHAQGLAVNTWTVNDAERARALAVAGVDAIITDDVPRVLGAI